MDRLVRARVLLAEAEALGVTIDDLVAVPSSSSSGGSSRAASSVPTLAEYVDTVAPSFSTKRPLPIAPTGGWRLPGSVTGRSTRSTRTTARRCWPTPCAGRSSAGRAATRSSRENCVAALRALFGRAERAGLLTKNPARDLDKPRRRASRRRALDDTELAEALDAVRTASQDPNLGGQRANAAPMEPTAASAASMAGQFRTVVVRRGAWAVAE